MRTFINKKTIHNLIKIKLYTHYLSREVRDDHLSIQILLYTNLIILDYKHNILNYPFSFEVHIPVPISYLKWMTSQVVCTHLHVEV